MTTVNERCNVMSLERRSPVLFLFVSAGLGISRERTYKHVQLDVRVLGVGRKFWGRWLIKYGFDTKKLTPRSSRTPSWMSSRKSCIVRTTVLQGNGGNCARLERQSPGRQGSRLTSNNNIHDPELSSCTTITLLIFSICIKQNNCCECFVSHSC